MAKNRHLLCAIAHIVCILSVFIGCSNMIAEYGDSGDNIIRKNTVGATNSITLRSLDFTQGNENSIFVAKTGSDSTGNGTAANPVASINHAITLCDPAHQKIVILDSGTYEEKGFEFTGNFRGLYAALGEKPVVEFIENPDFLTLAQNESIGEKTYFPDATHSMAAVELQNGNIFIAYQDYNDSRIGKYKVVDPVTGLETEPGGNFHDNSTYTVSAVMMNDGNVFIAYRDYSDGDKGKYVLMDTDNWSLIEIGTETEFEFHNAYTGFISSTVMNNGNIFIAYTDVNDWGKYLVLDPDDWSEVRSGSFYEGETDSVTVECLENGNIFIAYVDYDLGNYTGKYLVLDPVDSWNEGEAGTIPTGKTGPISSMLLSNGDIFVSFIDYGDLNKGKYIIIDHDTLATEKPKTTFHNDTTSNISPLRLSDGNIFMAYTDVGDSSYGKYLVIDISVNHLRVSVDTELNGLVLTSRDRYWLDSFISADNSKLTIKWCDIKDNYSSTSDQVCEAINTNSEISVSNTRFYNNDAGIHAVSGRVEIVDSHFYLNGNGYALFIEGAAVSAGDISVNHSDFFSNYGGIRFAGNDGATETVRNSIFHNNSNFGINADTGLSLSYSVITGSVVNVTYDTGVVTEDPGYVNDSAGVPDDIDLNIRVRETGYPADSPARGLADDGRNAGAYDVEYVVK